jgi:predicted DNA-binding transcriptional regulator AlpA
MEGDSMARPTLGKLLQHVNPNGEITTVNARTALGLSEDAWQTLMAHEGAPRPRREGRDYLLDIRELVVFLGLRAYVEAGITLTQWARMTHHGRKLLRALIAKRRAPQPIGYVHGHERFDPAEVRDWHAAEKRNERKVYTARTAPPTIPEKFAAKWPPRKKS